jgi:hypothetical protein
VTYTIDSITASNPSSDFSGLAIAGSFLSAPGGNFQYITGNGSVTASAFDADPTTLTPAIGSSYTRTFQLDGTANNGGQVAANFLAYFDLAFQNGSTDSYQVGLTLSYDLSANASGDNADTAIILNYAADHTNAAFETTADAIFLGTDSISTNQDLGIALLHNSHAFNFTLASGEFEALYTDAGIAGNLQASPVPLPSAVWLFASALLAIPGLKKAKRTA